VVFTKIPGGFFCLVPSRQLPKTMPNKNTSAGMETSDATKLVKINWLAFFRFPPARSTTMGMAVTGGTAL